MNVTLYLILIGVTILLSAFFSGTESAFNSANRMRLKKAAESGKKTSQLAYRICENFTTTLSAILIGNNLVNIAASSAATMVVLHLFAKRGIDNEGLASTVSTVAITLLILLFGEIIPKVFAKQRAEQTVRMVVVPIRIVTILLYPLVFIVTLLMKGLRKIWGTDKTEDSPSVTEEELSSIIDTVEEEGVIDEEKSELLQSTLEFSDTNVEEITTPRIDLIQIDIEDDPEAIYDTVLNSRYSRIPVYEDNIDNIIGILFLNTYYQALADLKEQGKTVADLDVRSLLRPPLFVYKTMKLPAVLNMMRENKNHLLIVTDEYGGTLGIVTMEDILEELVGDIWDESDEIVQMIEKIGDNLYEINGDMNIDDFFSEIDFDAEAHGFTCEYSTVGGWAVEMLNDAPAMGDSFTYEHLCIIVTEMDDMRVTKLTALVTEIKEDEEE